MHQMQIALRYDRRRSGEGDARTGELTQPIEAAMRDDPLRNQRRWSKAESGSCRTPTKPLSCRT
jgi:hypothetical protein